MAASILLTDGDSSEAKLLAQILSEAGLTVTRCKDAVSTLARLRELRPALIVIADALSDATGFELCDSVRKKPQLHATPMVLITGPASRKAAEAHRQGPAPATAYLTRPLEAAEVLAVLRAHLPELLPPEEPVADDVDPFQEPPTPRPPRSGGPDEKVVYFRGVVKAKEETLARARALHAEKVKELAQQARKLHKLERQLAQQAEDAAQELQEAQTRHAAALEKAHEKAEAAARAAQKTLSAQHAKALDARDRAQRGLEKTHAATVASHEEAQAGLHTLHEAAAEARAREVGLESRLTERTSALEASALRADELERELSASRGQLLELEVEGEALKASLEGAERSLEEARAQGAAQAAENDDLTSKLGELQGRLEGSVLRASEAGVQLEEQAKILAARASELAHAREQGADLSRELEQERAERARLEQARDELELRLTGLLAERKSLTGEIDALNASVATEQRARDAAVLSEIGSREELAALGVAREELARRAEALEHEQAALQERLGHLTHEKAAALERMGELDARGHELEGEVTRLKGEVKRGEVAFGAARAASARRITELEQAAAERGQQLEALGEARSKSDARAEALQEALEIEGLQTRALSTTRAELERARKELERVGAEERSQRARIGALEQRLADETLAREAAEAQREEPAPSSPELERARERIQALETRLREETQAREEVAASQRVDHTRVDLAPPSPELELARARVAAAEERIQDLEARIRADEETARLITEANAQAMGEINHELALAENARLDAENALIGLRGARSNRVDTAVNRHATVETPRTSRPTNATPTGRKKTGEGEAARAPERTVSEDLPALSPRRPRGRTRR